MRLTTQQKIQILENIDWDKMQNSNKGLCLFLTLDLINHGFNINQYHLPLYIDLFNFENACKFSTKDLIFCQSYTTMYWFNRDEQGYQERKAYVNWMIDEYRKQL